MRTDSAILWFYTANSCFWCIITGPFNTKNGHRPHSFRILGTKNRNPHSKELRCSTLFKFSCIEPKQRLSRTRLYKWLLLGERKCLHHSVQIAFLFLTHDDTHHIEGQMPLLTVFFEPLGLRKRRGSLFAVHLVQQFYLFLLFEKGQLIGGI